MRLIDADALNIRSYCRWFDDPDDIRVVERMIREAPAITPPPNAPLSLEELREMDGKPVWVVQPHEVLPPFWGIVDADDESVANGKYCANFEDYDTEWLAYRRKPEEVTA